MKLQAFVIAFAIALTTGCATIIHGTTQTVDFRSDPSGANITIDGKEFGQTPKSIPLYRKGRLKGESSMKTSYAVQISMEGYEPYEVEVKRTLDGWLFGNIIFGGIIGIIIDSSNGSMYRLKPDEIFSQMGDELVHNPREHGRIFIAASLNLDPSWEKISKLKPN